MRSRARFDDANVGRPLSTWITISVVPRRKTRRPVKSAANMRAMSAAASDTPRWMSPASAVPRVSVGCALVTRSSTPTNVAPPPTRSYGSGPAPLSLGADNTTFSYTIDPVYDATAIINWVNMGRPAGAVASYVNSTVPQLLNWIADRQDEGHPIYTGNISGANDMTAFVEDNWRRGQHIIMVDHINFDANGNPVTITLRDQIGPVYRTITDFARIYFLLGRAHAYDMP